MAFYSGIFPVDVVLADSASVTPAIPDIDCVNLIASTSRKFLHFAECPGLLLMCDMCDKVTHKNLIDNNPLFRIFIKSLQNHLLVT